MNRQDVYQAVTDRIVAAIEEGGVAPWRKPWIGGGPVNILNDKPYRGINIFLLGITPFADPRWGTFDAVRKAAVKHARDQSRTILEKQERRKGRLQSVFYEVIDDEEVWFAGGVRRGEKGTPIVLWKPVKKKRHEQQAEGEQTLDDTYMLLRTFTVFNAEQCDEQAPLPKGREHVADTGAEQIVTGYIGPTIANGSSAWYSPTTDTVAVPTPEMFLSGDGYYSTLFHELVHSTGHETRLNRLEKSGFGTGPYAKEELVAEMGAAMLCGVAGIDNEDQSAAYVSGWLERLQNDPKLVVHAAANAQKASDLILGVTFEERNDDSQVAVAA